jgi:hypothetical protein
MKTYGRSGDDSLLILLLLLLLLLLLPTSGGRSVGIVRSRTQATEFF